ncbi:MULTISPECIES: hypothetical protein [Pseudomonas]|uniref:Uncharacterized protein n=2 Tax=Pseudomonas viridiflava TaxID=33069 RepID=A0A1Y6JU14_PSEVI|nr:MULTISPECIES: hypothetical protein [Pseudomonas]KTC12293.1 hypothetical protein AO390_08870 [Pseudomonas marginalis ICMP 11289]VVN76736.1 hypothetical protein PS689_00784 [Pseudomonas fluorescens]MEE4088638.1 hypothetical protein [Pseudomonas viridiflava]MEE4142850.1 hypothetical protein [Pseudomonas viridiflava]MEE4156461.1 hypothetical protein [Pseudomonas viridiflava]
MKEADFLDLVNQRINAAAQNIIDKKNTQLDDISYGKLDVLLALRRALMGNATPEDIGMLDAINDALQALGILQAKETFFGRIER